MGVLRGLLGAFVISSYFLFSHGQRIECTQEAMADIVFLVDGSASIGLPNFKIIRQFLTDVVSTFDIGPNKIKVGMVQFSDKPRTEFTLDQFKTKQEILDYIKTLPYKTGGTNTGLGLKSLLEDHFVERAGSRANQRVPQIAVVITDGDSQDEVEPYAQQLRQKGIKLYAIGIKDANDTILKKIASQPYEHYVFSVLDFNALQEISLNVIQELCTTVEKGKECSEIPSADIVFLVDTSRDNTGEAKMQNIHGFLVDFLERLVIQPDKVRVGLAQFSDRPNQEFLLGAYEDKDDLMTKLRNIVYHKGRAKTGAALDFIRDNYFSQARENVPQIAIVITDGLSTDQVVGPAQELRKQGVIIFVVNTGVDDDKRLQAIANSPQEEFVIRMEQHRTELIENLHRKVCIAADDQLRALSLKFSDIFFLVDSTASRTEAQQIRTFMMRLVNQLNVGTDANRIGLAQFSENVNEEFLFSTKKTKSEIVSSIRYLKLKPKGLRTVGSAIEHARKNFFNPSAGSRIAQGFKQVLMVTTVGKSEDNVLPNARSIKRDGVSAIAVGLAEADIDELQDIASPNQSYTMNPQTIQQVQQKVKLAIESEQLLSVSEECKFGDIADIVFIVDISGNMGPDNFQLVRNFLLNTISGLAVGMEQVRIAIIYYSDVPRADVYLNTFSDKSKILQYVKRLSYGRGKAYTGAALLFAKDQVFTKERGSRSDLHVPQIAVVITDWRSADKVDEAAADLRRSGVTIFALGIKSAHEEELKQIASYPTEKFIFNIESFIKLDALSQIVTRSLCGDIIMNIMPLMKNSTLYQGCKYTAEADIYFLLDESGSITYGDFEDMKTFILSFLHIFDIGPDKVRIGVVKFASYATTVFRLDTYDSKAGVEKAVKDLFMEGGGTRADLGLQAMIPLFKQASQTRKEKVRELLIVITDGKSEAVGTPVKIPAEELRKENVTIYSVGVKDADPAELEEISGSPQRTFYVENYDGLREIKSKILKEICSFEACDDLAADIVFLIDGADAVDAADFTKTKELIGFAVEKLTIKEDKVRLAIVQYSTDIKVEVAMNALHNKDEIFKSLKVIRQLGGKTYTGNALKNVTKVFEESSKERSNTLQVLVVVTDSLSKDDVSEPAKYLRDRNIHIYAIGLGHASRSQLLNISGLLERVYLEDNFGTLQALGGEVVFKICNTECKRPELLDVIFVVDGSGNVAKENFQLFKRFMQSIVKKADVGDKRVRFGVNIYSDHAQSEFSLNKYFTKAEILNAISQLHSLGGNRNTAQALKYSLSRFTAEHGGRRAKNVAQVLCLITDGEVADTEGLVNWPGDLAASEVNMFALGMPAADLAELRSITRNDLRTYYVNTYEEFRTLYKPVTQQLCNLTKPVCMKEVADVVILIDGSESISEVDWEILKSSTINLVKRLEIAPDLWRVAVAQFSDKVIDHFYLNKYQSIAGVEQGIHEISQRKQGTNTWDALRIIDDYFKPEHGSRLKEGVSQNLLLITDGKANDKEDLDALAQLRSKDIEIFAIGIGQDLKYHELLKIAGSSERVFYETFESLQLKTTTMKVLQAICATNEIPNPRGCTIDIGIGFDVSHRTTSQTLLGPHTESLVAAAIRHLTVVEELCCVTNDTIETKVGFRLVSGEDGKDVDDFTFETYNENVVKKVLRLKLTEPLAFNALLLNSFQQKFSSSSAGVKVFVIFTDGMDDTVEHLKASSESLRRSGVSALLIVSLSGFVNYQQLEFGRGFSYMKPLSIDMLNVGSALQEQIKAVALRECCNVSCTCSGHGGPPGRLGISGLKGFPGIDGGNGYPGEHGSPGGRGAPGLNGTQGDSGCSGKRGFKGSIGYTGNKGENGELGLDGVDGEQGETGVFGSGGPKGNPGRPGLNGPRGTSGPKGESGVRGDPGIPGADNNVRGSKGEEGYPGPPGDQGPDGASGFPGETGEPGFPGRKGPPGLPGLPSTQQGEPGEEGPTGHPGLQGPSGRSGPKGENGDQGLSGVQGLYGPVGDKGAKGNPGRQGPRGQPGDMGTKGDAGPEGFKGPTGHSGADGLGPQGPMGRKGSQGFPGYPGLQGEDGTKGSSGGRGPKSRQGQPGYRGNPGNSGNPGDPGMTGHRGPEGLAGPILKTECELVNYARENCACCRDHTKCPSYPTELVVALDMSADVTPQTFERIRSAALALLNDIHVAESNCPVGARVSIVSYNSETKYQVRFSDHYQKKQLLEGVRGIPLQRSRSQRNIGQAIRYVTENVFKRVRDGKLVRKVAIFFTNGPSQDTSAINTAMLQLKASEINLGVIAFRDAPNIRSAIEADETGSFMIFEPERASLIRDCIICFDRCNPDLTCLIVINPEPEEVDVDLTVMMDASWDLQENQYSDVKKFLVSLLDVVDVSREPTNEDGKARIAIYQQSSIYPDSNVKEVFGLSTFKDRATIKRSILEDMQQVGGSSRLNSALQWMVTNALKETAAPRKKRMVLNILSENSMGFISKEELDYVSKLCQCNDVVMVTLTVGNQFSWTQAEGLTTFPTEQHLVHLGEFSPANLKYAKKFLRAFLRMLTRDLFPKPSFQNSECSSFVPRPNTDRPAFLPAGTDEPLIAPTEGFELLTTEPEEDMELYPDAFEENKMFTDVEEEPTEIDVYPTSTEPYFEIYTDLYDDMPQSSYGDEPVKEHTKPNTDVLQQSETDETKDTKDDVNQSLSKAPCLLDKDVGTVCSTYQSRWYYNRNTKKCTHFWYGGCDGNSNRFPSEAECLNTCGGTDPEALISDEASKSNDMCQLAQDAGKCYDFTLRWYYNASQRVCALFWYGGCAGNGNRFDTQQECEALCLDKQWTN